MLSRQELDRHLSDYINVLSAGNTTYAAFESLNIANDPDLPDDTRARFLRDALARILTDETMAEYHDRAFALQMLLARNIPLLTHRDPLTHERIDNSGPLIYFSDGRAYPKSLIEKFYQRPFPFSYNEVGQYLDLDGLPISAREVESLQQQGVRFKQEPSIAEKIWRVLGRSFGFGLMTAFYIAAVLFMPVYGACSVLVLGLTNVLVRPSTLHPSRAFIIGVVAALLSMAVLTFAFPPVAMLLVSAGLISAGAASSAVALFSTFILPFIPVVVSIGALITSLVSKTPFSDILYTLARAPDRLIVGAFEKSFGLIGKGINSLCKALHFIAAEPPRPPSVSDEELQAMNDAAESAAAPSSTTQHLILLLRADDDLAQVQTAAVPPQPPQSGANAARRTEYYTGNVYKLGDEVAEIAPVAAASMRH